MKIRIFSFVLSLIVITLTVVSCVDLPLEPENPSTISGEIGNSATDPVSTPSDSSAEQSELPPESSDESTAEPSSDEPSSEIPSEASSDEPSSDEPSSEETSQPITVELPYPDLTKLSTTDITASEYDDYFINSMFIGNSIMVHFYNYLTSTKSKIPGFLGSCKVFASSNFSARENAKTVSDDTWHPRYQSVKMNCADAVAASAVDTVYLSVMALNELALHSADKCVEGTFNSTIALIESIKAKTPNVRIVILSNTYMVYNFNGMLRLNNANISALNNRVLAYCNENGIDYIDVSTSLMDGNVLSNDLCRDWEDEGSNCGCHITNNGYARWTGALRNYACLKQAGAWVNPVLMPVYTRNAQ